jgi:hypothetical protein
MSSSVSLFDFARGKNPEIHCGVGSPAIIPKHHPSIGGQVHILVHQRFENGIEIEQSLSQSFLGKRDTVLFRSETPSNRISGMNLYRIPIRAPLAGLGKLSVDLDDPLGRIGPSDEFDLPGFPGSRLRVNVMSVSPCCEQANLTSIATASSSFLSFAKDGKDSARAKIPERNSAAGNVNRSRVMAELLEME